MIRADQFTGLSIDNLKNPHLDKINDLENEIKQLKEYAKHLEDKNAKLYKIGLEVETLREENKRLKGL